MSSHMTPTGQARDRLELLAPAGDAEAMRAAVANGADAVYLGLQEFNARRRAANFTLETLPQVVDQLHGWNVKAYVAFNTLIFSDELERAARYIAGIAEAGADALIVQDLGVLRLARAMCPALPVHASTQMTQTHVGGINFLRELGATRVILARELSLKDIAAIRAATDMELEAFVHGALCVSYSGQCLASESLFGRSANRGECAQPCRLPYQLVVDGEPREMPDGAHLLSPKDLATYERIPDLLAAGVTSFKIEGRLKSAEYVAAATGVYRAAIDAAVAGRTFTISKQQLGDLEASFSRGFTQGFLDGNRHQDLVDRSSPKSRGPRVGIVTGKSGAGVTVRLSDVEGDLPLKPGDGVVFGGAGAEEQGGRVYSVQPILPQRLKLQDPPAFARGWHGLGREAKPNEIRPRRMDLPASRRHGLSARRRRGPDRAIPPQGDAAAGQVEVLLTFGSGDLNLAAIRVGSTVWKSDDPHARRRIGQTYSRIEPQRRTPLRARARLLETGKLVLELAEFPATSCQFPVTSSLRTEMCSDAPLARADKHPLTVELLREQLARLGDTPYELRDVELLGPQGATDSLPVLAPKSVLNDLRRRAVADLLEQRRVRARKPVEDMNALARLQRQPPQGAATTGPNASSAQSRLHVLVRTREQLEAVLHWAATRAEPLLAPSAKRGDGTSEGDPLALRSGLVETATRVGMVYCDLPDLSATRAAAAACRAAKIPFAIAGPRILRPKEEALLKPLLALRPDALLVRNLASVRYAQENAPDLPLIGDFSLNAANELAGDLLLESGLARVTASCDLNADQLAAMVSSGQFPVTSNELPVASDWKPETGNWQPETGNWELVVHQHMPMFHTAYCLAAACLGTGNDCRDCDRPCERFALELRDRLGVVHPLLTDAAGRCTIFNARPQSAAELWAKLARLGISHFRIELLRESAAATTALLAAYEGLLLGQITPREAVNRIASLYAQGITPGTFAFTEREARR